MISSELVEKLTAVVGEDFIHTAPEALRTYDCDALTIYKGTPGVVVIPESTDDIRQIARLCHEAKVPLIARGAGTCLSGGATPAPGGVLLVTLRMNRVLEIDYENLVARVQPGVINLHLSNETRPHGFHYAPDPSSQMACTIGGNAAENSGGAHCLKYGMTANHVLGMKAVLATGEVVEFGGRSREQVGPDFTGLFCGSEGLFGIALEITLRRPGGR